MNEKQKIYKLAAICLQYPSEDWLGARELKNEINKLENKEIRQNLSRFVDYLISQDIHDLWASYVDTFDFNDKTSLYMTYSKLGDERERGEALVELKEQYREAGFELDTTELPDYLPIMLEFGAISDENISDKLFQKHYEAISELQGELEAIGNPYHFVIKACIDVMEKPEKIQMAGGAS